MHNIKLKFKKLFIIFNVFIFSVCNVTPSYATGIEVVGGIAIGKFVGWLCTAALTAGALYIGYEETKDDIKSLNAVISSIPYVIKLHGLKSIEDEKKISKIQSSTGMTTSEANSISDLYDKVVADPTYVITQEDYSLVQPALEKVARKYVFANGIEYKENSSFNSEIKFDGVTISDSYFSDATYQYACDNSIPFLGGGYANYYNAKPVSSLNLDSVLASFVQGAVQSKSSVHSVNIPKSEPYKEYWSSSSLNTNYPTNIAYFPFQDTDIHVQTALLTYERLPSSYGSFEKSTTFLGAEFLYYTADNSPVNFSIQSYRSEWDNRIGYALVGESSTGSDIFVFNPLYSGFSSNVSGGYNYVYRLTYNSSTHRDTEAVILSGKRMVMSIFTNALGIQVAPNNISYDRTIINTYEEPKVVDKPYIGWATDGISANIGTSDSIFDELVNCDNLGDSSLVLGNAYPLITDTDRNVVGVPVSDDAITDSPIIGDDVSSTDIPILGDIWQMLKNIYSSIVSLPGSIVSFFTAQPTTSLDFSPLEISLIDKFPFSLPFDLFNAFNSFIATPEVPQFEIKFDEGLVGSASFTFDFTPFSKLASILRYFILVVFITNLIKKTRDMIGG